MVFKRLFSRSAKPAPRETRVPSGQRIYAIGDIHGRLDLLDQLLAQIDSDHAARPSAEQHLILLGDLIDRGPASRGVIERVMQLARQRTNFRCLGGNHEDLLLRTLSGDTKSAAVFHRVGGRETLLSYGVSESDYENADFPTLCDLAKRHVPEDHAAFVASLEDYVAAGDYLFVHAGISPGKPLAAQLSEELRWIRREFTECDEAFEKFVIHGHTITEAVDLRTNRIGIDTGAYATNRLTAIGLEGGDRWFLSTLA